MNANICRCLLALLSLCLLASCVSNDPTESAYEPLTKEALVHFAALRAAGKLPGIAPNDSGELETEAIPQKKKADFPVTVVLHVTKSDRTRYSYQLTKAHTLTAWTLTQAWRVPAPGQREPMRIE
jgi:hypothetical protein